MLENIVLILEIYIDYHIYYPNSGRYNINCEKKIKMSDPFFSIFLRTKVCLLGVL